MIELNLTYEESKKILELGYNFNKLCCKFELRDYMGLSKFFVRLDDCLVIECDTEIDYINYNGLRNWCESHKMGLFTVPIIPKAALEACLPFKVGIDARYFRKFYETEYSPEEFEVFEAGVNELESNAVIFSSSSIYEMFIWLHENYPAELKKKFDEVMN
jgi:hypothetical protein